MPTEVSKTDREENNEHSNISSWYGVMAVGIVLSAGALIGWKGHKCKEALCQNKRDKEMLTEEIQMGENESTEEIEMVENESTKGRHLIPNPTYDMVNSPYSPDYVENRHLVQSNTNDFLGDEWKQGEEVVTKSMILGANEYVNEDDPDYVETIDGFGLVNACMRDQSISGNNYTPTYVSNYSKRDARNPDAISVKPDNKSAVIHHVSMEADYVSSPEIEPGPPSSDYFNADLLSTLPPNANTPEHMGTEHFSLGTSVKKEGHNQDKNKELLDEFECNARRYVIKDRDGRKGVERDTTGIGEGRFGAVFAGKCRGMPVALKRMDDIEQFVREGSLFFECCLHLNICRFYGIYITDDDAYIVMELFKDGSILETMVGSNSHDYTMEEKISICHQLSCGLYHLHCEEVIHADLSLRNCLIEFASFRAAITDFGLAQSMKTPRQMRAFAPRWASPELIQSRIPDEFSDVWALGITFWEIFHNGARPFGRLITKQVINQLVQKELAPKCSEDIPYDIKALIRGMCSAKTLVTDRWKAVEVMQRWENLLNSQKSGEGGAEMI